METITRSVRDLDESLWLEISIKALREKRKVGELVNEAIAEYLDKNHKDV